MKPFAVAGLLIEILVCFGPMLLMLILGIVLLPLQIPSLLEFPEESAFDAAGALVRVVGGLAGLVAMFNVLVRLISPTAWALPPRVTLAMILMGVLPVAAILFETPSSGWRLAALAPLVATAHIVYLARDYLFSRPAQ